MLVAEALFLAKGFRI